MERAGPEKGEDVSPEKEEEMRAYVKEAHEPCTPDVCWIKMILTELDGVRAELEDAQSELDRIKSGGWRS